MQPATDPNAPPVMSLADILAQINPLYDAQRQTLQGQIGTTQANGQATLTGLDAAKNQAFGQINQNASDHGLLFSGIPADQQASYIGAKYLPARAQVANNIDQTVGGLNNQLAGIDTQVRTQAQKTQTDQQTAYSQYQQEQQKLAQALAIANASNDTRLQAAQIGANASMARGATSANNAATRAQLALQAQYKAGKLSSGNYSFTGPNGSPVNLYGYLSGSGQGVDTLLNILQNGSKYDQGVYKNSTVQKAIKSNDPTAIYNAVMKADSGHFYGLK